MIIVQCTYRYSAKVKFKQVLCMDIFLKWSNLHTSITVITLLDILQHRVLTFINEDTVCLINPFVKVKVLCYNLHVYCFTSRGYLAVILIEHGCTREINQGLP